MKKYNDLLVTIGWLLSDSKKLKEQNKTMSEKIDSLCFWCTILKWFFGGLVTLLVGTLSFFWNYPDAWLRLVQLLKQ